MDYESNGDLLGFAKLGEYDILSPRLEGVTDETIAMEAIIHGNENGVVRFKRDSELYKYALFFTASNTLSELSGQYIPVDKVEDGVYEPSESLFEISSVWNGNRPPVIDNKVLDWLEKIPVLEKVKKSIEYGYIEYDREDGQWESRSRILIHFMYLNMSHILISLLTSCLLSPVTIFTLLSQNMLGFIPSFVSLKQLVYTSIGLIFITLVLLQIIVILLVHLIILNKYRSKTRECPID